MPGVFAHGDFDTWSPGYLMFVAASHNGINRLYETFGNAGADTLERTLTPQQYERTWYRQNPPLPKTRWSQRDNNNYEQTGLLISLDHFAENSKLFLHNFYLKSKRSIEKPKNEGPAAYVFPADDPRRGGQAELLSLLQLQGSEVVQASAPFSATIRKAKDKDDKNEKKDKAKNEPETEVVEFPADRISCVWISRTAASQTCFSIISIGARTILSVGFTTIRRGRLVNSVTLKSYV